MDLCQYSDIFGKPNTGVHSYRIGTSITPNGFALVDILLTILLAGVITYATGSGFIITLSILFILSIALHSLFCVDSTAIRIYKSLDRRFFT